MGVYAQRHLASGLPTSEFRVNSTTAGDQQHSSVAMAPDGSSIFVWEGYGQDGDHSGVYFQRYSTEGQPLGGEFQANVTTLGYQQNPTVAYLSGGNFVVVWDGKGTGDVSGVFGRMYDSNGTALGSEFLINTTTAYQQQNPAVAALPDGGFLAAWDSAGDSDGSATGIFAQRFDASGAHVGGEFLVNTTTASFQQYPAIGVAPDGKFVVAWQSNLQDGSGYGIYAQRYTAAGAKLGGEFAVNTFTDNDQLYPSVACNDHGGFAISFNGKGSTDNAGVYIREFGPDGTALASESLVNATTASAQQDASVAAAGSGYVVAWSGSGIGDSDGVFLRQLGSGPTTSGIGNVSVMEDASQHTVSLWSTFEDAESSDQRLSYQVLANSNPGLFSQIAIDPATGSLLMDFLPDGSGVAILTVQAADPGGLTSQTSFTVTVTAVNDAPEFNLGGSQMVDEDAGPQSVSGFATGIRAGPTDESGQTLNFLVSTDHPELFAQGPTIDANGMLTYQPAPNAFGAAVVTVSLHDDGGTANGGIDTSNPQTFTLTVNAVDDAPTVLFFDPDGNPANNDIITGAGLGGSGIWSAGSGNVWYNPLSGQDIAWTDGVSVVFTGAAGTVTISGQVSTGSVTISTANYLVQSGTLLSPASTGMTITVSSGTDTISSTITGSGGLTKSGTGSLLLGGANTYSDTTTISDGTLKLGASNVLPDGSGKGNVVLSTGATLDMGGYSDTINGLSGAGTVDNTSGTGTYTLSVGGNNATSAFSGMLKNTTGTLALVKTGTGTLALSGGNTFTGLTTVCGGTLEFSGPTTAPTIGSILIGGGDISIDNGVTLTSRTGSIEFASNNSIKPTGSTGAMAFTAVNAIYSVTVDAGITGTISAAITGTTTGNAIKQLGPGTLVLGGQNKLVTDANSNLTAYVALDGGGTVNITGLVKAASPSQSGSRSNSTSTVGTSSVGNTLNVSGTGQVISGRLDVGGSVFGNNSVNISSPGTKSNPSYWLIASNAQLNVGVFSSNNSVTVSNGAYLYQSLSGGTNTWTLGTNAGANNNSLTITGTGSTVDRTAAAGSALNVGVAGNSNSVTVSAGGQLLPRRLIVGSGTAVGNGSNNSVLVTGAGSAITVNNDSNGVFQVGSGIGSSGNSVTVANGALMNFVGASAGRAFSIGSANSANNNFVRITGAGSSAAITNQGGPLTIGGLNTGTPVDSTASGNHLDVYAGASLTATYLQLMGVNSAFNLGDGTGVSTATLGNTAFNTSPAIVNLSSASARMNVNGALLTAGASNTLIGGPGSVQLNGPAYIATAGFNNSITAAIGGSGSLTKCSAGTLTLSGTDTYTGETSVTAGMLAVNGALTNSSVTVSGGILAGSGTISGAVSIASGAVLSPGYTTTGILGTGNLTLASGSQYVVQLNGDIAGTSYCQTNVTGTVSLGGAQVVLNGSRVVHDGTTIVILTNDGNDAINGTFADLGEGAAVTLNGIVYHITYTYNAETGQLGTGNDVALLDNIALSGLSLSASAQTINENGSVLLSGTFNDPGSTSGHTATIDWGDGSTATTLDLAAGVFQFNNISHQYFDNLPANTPYTINVTVSNLSNATVATDSIQVTALNVAPTATIITNLDTVSVHNLLSVSMTGSDTSSIDAASLHYFFSTSRAARDEATYTTAGTAASETISFATSGAQTIFARVLDKDGGYADVQTSVTVTPALTLYWDPNGTAGLGGSGTWDATTANWTTDPQGGSLIAWVPGSSAVFAGTMGTVTVSEAETINSLEFDTANYILQAGSLVLPDDGSNVVLGDGLSATISSVVSGSNLIKQGDGTLVLSGANSYTGSTTVSGGTVIASGGAAIPDTSKVILDSASGATLNLLSSEMIGSLAGGGFVDLDGNVLTVGADNTNAAYAGTIGGSGQFVKLGSGTQTLSGQNTFTGGTTLSGGTLSVNTLADSAADPSALGTSGTITVSNATFQYTGQAAISTSRWSSGSATGTTVLDITQAAASLTLTGGYSNNQNMTKLGSGTLVLSGVNQNGFNAVAVDVGTLLLAMKDTNPGAYNAVGSITDVQPGATLQIGRYTDGNFYDGQIVAIPGDASRQLHMSGGTLDLSGDTVNRLPAIDGTGLITNSAVGTTSVLNVFLNYNKTFSGTIEDGAGQIAVQVGTAAQNGAVVLDGTVWTLAGHNTYSGGTTVTAHGTLKLGADNALPTTPILHLGDPNKGWGILDLGGHNLTLSGLYTSSAVDTVTNSSAVPATLAIDNAADITIDGRFMGNLSLAKYGAGRLTLNGQSNSSGQALVYDGTLDIEGIYAACAQTVPGFGNPQVVLPTDPIYVFVIPPSFVGSRDYSISGTLSSNNGGASVFGTDWQSAVQKVITSTVVVQQNSLYDYKTYGDRPFSVISQIIRSGSDVVTGTGFLIGRALDVANAVNSTVHSGEDYFNYRRQGLSGNEMIVAMEDKLGQNPDRDYNDAIWVVGVASGDLAIDSNNNSLTGAPDLHHPEETTNSYIDDAKEDQKPGKFIAVQKDTNGLRVAMDVRINDWTPGVSQARFVCTDLRTGSTSNPGLQLWTTETGSTGQIEFNTPYSPENSPLNLTSGQYKKLYVAGQRAGEFEIKLEINPLGSSGTWQSVDKVRFTVLDENVTCLECTYGITVSPAGVFWSDNGPLSGSVTMNSASPGDTRFGLPAHLVLTGNGVAVLQKDKIAIWDYDSSHNNLTARKPQAQGTMEKQGTGTNITFVETLNGTKWTFTAPVGDNVPDYFGLLTSQVDAYGIHTDYSYVSGTNQLQDVISTVGPTVGGIPSQQRIAYSFSGSDLIETVTLGYADDVSSGGTEMASGKYWHTSKTVGSAQYSFNTSSDGKNDLKLIRTKDADGNVTGATYYSYYTSDDLKHQVKYVLNPASVAQVMQANGFGSDYSQLDNSNFNLGNYADNHLTYDAASGRVTSNTVKGSGVTSYDYHFSTLPDGINTWSVENEESQTVNGVTTTTETFYNFEGDVLFSDTSDGSSHQYTYNQYDSYGNLVESAQSSAVSDHSDPTADSQLVVSFNTSGLFNVYSYYTSTTATTSASGDDLYDRGVKGWLHQTFVAQWKDQADAIVNGTLTDGSGLQSTVDYIAATDDNGTSYYTFHSIEYAKADGADPRITTYAYTFDGQAIATATTTLTAVDVDHGGTGSASTSTDIYDTLGRVVWSRDAAGSVSYTQYDSATGAVCKQIQDADVSNNVGAKFAAADYTQLTEIYTANGWTLPTGKNLVSTYVHDSQGRTIKETAPDGQITYTVYNDTIHTEGTATILNETRVYTDWNSTTHTTNRPIHVSREVVLGSDHFTESLTLSWSGAMAFNGDNSPKGDDSLNSSHAVIESLSRSIMNDAGQVRASRQYSSLKDGNTTIAYSTSLALGAKDLNYFDTEYIYDSQGRSLATVDASGAIQYTVYDGQGRVSDEWAGSRDETVTATNATVVSSFTDWLQSNTGNVYNGVVPGVQLYKLSHTAYDADGNTIESDAYFDVNGTATPRKTCYQYDWRGRQIGTLGPDGVATIDNLDNLGEVIATVTAANVSHTAGQPFNLANAKVLSYTTTDYNVRGLVYATTQHDVAGATVAWNTVVTDAFEITLGNNTQPDITYLTWFDNLDRTVKTQQPDGLIQKTAYNSLGQVDAEYTVSSEGTGTSPDTSPYNTNDDVFVSVTAYDYDSFGRQIAVEQGMDLASTKIVSRTWYDSAHNGSGTEQFRTTGVSTVKPGSNGGSNAADPNNYALTTYGYDPAGRQNSTVSPLGSTTVDTFDMLGRTTQTDTYVGDTNSTLVSETVNTYTNDRLSSSSQQQVNNSGSIVSGGAITTTYSSAGDPLGRQNKVIDPTGAYTLTTSDLQGNMLWQESYSATDSVNPIDVKGNVYDATTGRLTQVLQGTTQGNATPVTVYRYDTDHDGTSGVDSDNEGRVMAVGTLRAIDTLSHTDTDYAWTTYGYDGFSRQNLTTTPAPGNGPHAITTEQYYEPGIGRPTVTESYWTVDNGVTKHYVSASQNIYGGSGNVFLVKTQGYQVSTTSDTTDPINLSHLDTSYTYGDYGRVVKTTNPDGSFTATAYSLGGTVTSTYRGCFLGAGSDPGISGDTIVEQTAYQYDDLGDVILTANYQRHEGISDVGALTPSNARVSYVAAWYDSLGRNTDVADYGAPLDTFARPDSVPARPAADAEDSVHVTSYAFDGYGRQNLTTNPKGIKTLQVFDALGRVIYTIANFKAGSTYWEQSGTVDDYSRPKPHLTTTDVNQIIHYDYGDNGQLSAQTVIDPKCDGNETGYQADNQVTRYIYSGDLNATHQGSPVPRGDLLRAVVYPDNTPENTSTASIINALNTNTSGDFVEFTYYASGAQHTKTDQRGVVHDYSYDSLGRVTEDTVTSLGRPNQYVDSTVLDIATTYNDRGQVLTVTSYDTADLVNRTDDDIVNQIAYTYTGFGQVETTKQEHDGAVTTATPSVQYGYDNLARLESVTYPENPTDQSATPRVVGYRYGDSSNTASIDDQISAHLSRVSAITDGTTDLAQYTYLGAGTIINTAHPGVDGGLDLTLGNKDNGYNGLDRFGRVVDQLWKKVGETPQILDEFLYDFDAAGNRSWKDNVKALDALNLDEVYAYDDLYRLKGTDRGKFVDGVFAQDNNYQDWTLDGLGNFAEFTSGGTTQQRTVNAANEIQTISGSTITPTYDDAGNMISMPKTGAESTRLFTVYDAWNRVKKVYVDDGDGYIQPSDAPGGGVDALLATYEFDGQNRRIEKTTTAASGDARQVDYFFNENWQVLEERTTRGTGAGATMAINQYVWDLSYIDAPIVRFTQTPGNAETAVYFTWDANHNITAEVDASGTVLQRFVFDAYGKVTAYQPNWASAAAPTTDGPLYCGYWLDTETGFSRARMREYVTSVSTWDAPDPMGYAAGDANLLRYCENKVTSATDPSGLADDYYTEDPGQNDAWQLQFKKNENAQWENFKFDLETVLSNLTKFEQQTVRLLEQVGQFFKKATNAAGRVVNQIAGWFPGTAKMPDVDLRRPKTFEAKMMKGSVSGSYMLERPIIKKFFPESPLAEESLHCKDVPATQYRVKAESFGLHWDQQYTFGAVGPLANFVVFVGADVTVNQLEISWLQVTPEKVVPRRNPPVISWPYAKATGTIQIYGGAEATFNGEDVLQLNGFGKLVVASPFDLAAGSGGISATFKKPLVTFSYAVSGDSLLFGWHTEKKGEILLNPPSKPVAFPT